MQSPRGMGRSSGASPPLYRRLEGSTPANHREKLLITKIRTRLFQIAFVPTLCFYIVSCVPFCGIYTCTIYAKKSSRVMLETGIAQIALICYNTMRMNTINVLLDLTLSNVNVVRSGLLTRVSHQYQPFLGSSR